jgi:TetR/AcrR family transcriptional repressor of nem operon
MSDMKSEIMDAAEVRIRIGGFSGFSFREIAADVGIKSSSVHYHFPTKDDLAAAVIRRWSENANKAIDKELKKDPDPVRAWRNAFRNTARSKLRMCPCTVLAASARDLPEKVAAEVKNAWRTFQDRMVAEGLTERRAAEVLATVTGALILANVLGDSAEFDLATEELAA